jgi:ketosteroid isomerase-like protein
MSKENVEVMQAAFAAWNAGDMDGFRELLAPDVVMRLPEGWPEPGPYVGREAVMRQGEQQRETTNLTRPFCVGSDSIVLLPGELFCSPGCVPYRTTF